MSELQAAIDFARSRGHTVELDSPDVYIIDQLELLTERELIEWADAMRSDPAPRKSDPAQTDQEDR